MAIEKTISTRILNKIDTLENWSKSSLLIKQGEICLATVAASAGTGLEEPVIMAKIGTAEEKTFAELPWSFYAKASDVLTACKSEAGLTSFINNVIANAGIATDEAMGKLAERVGKLEGDENTAGSVAKAIKDAIDTLNLADTYAAKEHKHTKEDITDFAHTHVAADITDLDDTIKGYDYATKTELGDVDKKFADYKTAADQKAIDDEQDRRLGLLEAKPFDTYAVKTEVEGALALKADKSFVEAMYTNAQIDELVQDAKDYADANDADTKYGIVYDSDNKKIKLVEGGSEVEIDATDFIKDGMIETVTIGDDNDLIITFNTAAGKENIVLPLDQLVDIYTGVEGARVKVVVASDKSISAELVAGSISKNYLDADVQASLGKADTAIQAHQDISHLATTEELRALANGVVNNNHLAVKNLNTRVQTLEAIDHNAYVDADATLKTELQGEIATALETAKADAADKATVILAEAQKYADGLASNYATAEQGAKADSALQAITTTENGGLKVTNNNQVDIDDSIVFILDCGNATV